METFFPFLLAMVLAGILTYCDLDTVFDAPPSLAGKPKYQLMGWWWGFVFVNGLLAGVLYYSISKYEAIKDGNPFLIALMAGAGYSMLVRLKFTTLPINGKETPIGLETFYEGLKNLIHKRINRLIREWRIQESEELSKSDLLTLRQRARMLVMGDVLMSDEERQRTIQWIDNIVNGDGMDEVDRCSYLAVFIITGKTRANS